jgi:tetratricopeptide (TPR) repeat protein
MFADFAEFDEKSDVVAKVNTLLGARSYDEAMTAATDAAAKAREAGDKKAELVALRAVVYTQAGQKKYPDAVKTTKQMSEMAKEMGDLDEEGTAQLLTAIVLMASKAYDEVIEVGQSAALLFKQFGNRTKTGLATHVIAKACLAEGYYEDAKELAEQALILFRQVKSKEKQGFASITMSSALSGMGDSGKASYRAEQASEIFKSLGKSAEAGQACNTGAMAFAAKFKADASAGGREIVRLANASLKLYEKAGDTTSAGYATSVSTLGFGYFASGDFDSAEAKAKEAQAIFQGLSEQAGEATCLTTLAEVSFAKGDAIDAVSTARQAVGLFEEAGEDKMAQSAQALINKFQATPEDLAQPKEEDKPKADADGADPPMVQLRNLVPGIEKCIIYTQYDAYEGRSATTAARPRPKSERDAEKAGDAGPPKEQAVFAVRWVKAQPLGGGSSFANPLADKEAADKTMMMPMSANAPNKAMPVGLKKTPQLPKAWDALFG